MLLQKPLKFLLRFIAGVFTIRELAEFLEIALEAHAEHEHIAPGWLGECFCSTVVCTLITAAGAPVAQLCKDTAEHPNSISCHTSSYTSAVLSIDADTPNRYPMSSTD